MERKWKLGDDMHPNDAIFDLITFADIILAVHCNERVIDKNVVKRTARDILESRLEDFYYLLDNNIEEIIVEAMKGRN